MVLFGHIAYRWSKFVVFQRIGGIRTEWFYLGKSSWIRSNFLLFGQNLLYSGNLVVIRHRGCFWAKWFGCIRANRLYLGIIGSIRAKWLYLGESYYIRAKYLYSGKMVLFGQSECIRTKVVVFGQSGSFLARWLYLEKVVVSW